MDLNAYYEKFGYIHVPQVISLNEVSQLRLYLNDIFDD